MTSQLVESPYLVPFDGGFRVAEASSRVPGEALGKKEAKKILREVVKEIADLQEMLYASDNHSVLLVFQAMDAAGKDGTIRAVMSGINPAGCQVHSFKQPSKEELDHDFLWRTTKSLPERGRIGIFNRSYYEEVLVVKVHPEWLGSQKLPDLPAGDLSAFWEERYASIRAHERHLAMNGTVILKFWLNVSHDEQRQRFLDRIDTPAKNWKFSSGDVRERGFWPDYMAAYEDVLNATSRPWAPWYAIPADDKRSMRIAVAEIVRERLRKLDLRFPELPDDEVAELAEMRAKLTSEKPLQRT